MPRCMNDIEAASDGQYFPRDQRLVDGNRVHSPIGRVEQFTQHSPQEPRCRTHRPKWSSALGQGDIELVHVSPRTGLSHDRSGATDMIRVAVSENQVLELVWRMAKPSDRTEDGCLLIRVTGVDQGQPVVALDQESICHPHWDDVHTFDHTLHGHDSLNPAQAAVALPWVPLLGQQVRLRPHSWRAPWQSDSCPRTNPPQGNQANPHVFPTVDKKYLPSLCVPHPL